MFFWCKIAGWEFVGPAHVKTRGGRICNLTLAPPRAAPENVWPGPPAASAASGCRRQVRRCGFE
eukprot:4729718-Pyramimonas_sp.AAC.1